MNTSLLIIPWIAIALLGQAPPPPAGDAPADDKARAASFLEIARLEAAAYSVEDATGAKLTLHPEPVLRWSNPVVGSIHGNVFVWTAKGRPEAVGSFYKWYAPSTHRTNEFTSLAAGPLVAVRDGRRAWVPSRPGVEFRPIPGAPAPADAPAQRLRQIRALAADFAAWETTRSHVERDLRLLSQPIYRYEKTEGDLIDGALFTFVLSTDPEALLLIQARRPREGVPRWEYAVARMTGIAMRATYKGAEVWNVPKLDWATIRSASEPYATFRIDDPKASPPRNP